MYDVIIIGGGPAGITAGIYIKRAGFKVLIISKGEGALIRTEKIENYYGFEMPISGKELIEKGEKQAKNLGIELIKKEVIGIKYTESGFEVMVANQSKDDRYVAETVVIATGVNRNKPNMKGLQEFEGKGVSYCAVCDAPFYRNKDVAVLGNGEYAIGEIEELLPIAKSVTMLTNGKKPIENRSIDVQINEKKIREFRGSNKIEKIEFEDDSSQKIDGVFIAQGTAGCLEFAKKLGAKTENNNIVVNDEMQTSIENIYACGDCTGGILQISKAVYEGTKAGLAICRAMMPVVAKIADENEGKIKVCKVNVDEEPDLAEKFGVMSIPTFVAIKNGKVLGTSIGVQDEEEILKMFDK